jgi:hypothetical protein
MGLKAGTNDAYVKGCAAGAALFAYLDWRGVASRVPTPNGKSSVGALSLVFMRRFRGMSPS